jgi:hypothetical protein
MSRSNPVLQNPCKKFIQYKADEGKFSYYDKEAEDSIEIQFPIYFVVLDELSTITGFSKKYESGIYSNEVHRVADEILRVKTFKGGAYLAGLYKDIKDNIVALGGKYTKSIYAMLLVDEPELVNFQFKGAAFSAWLDKKVNTDNQVVGITGTYDEKNGATTFKVPVFEGFKLDKDVNDSAVLMDTVLQAYLREYKAQQHEKEVIKTEVEAPQQPEPFQSDKWFSGGKPVPGKQPAQISDINDLPF